MNYTLSVGFNGDIELLKNTLEEFKNKIETIYTGGYLKEVSSGRFQFSDGKDTLKNIIDIAHSYGTKVAITLNSPCNVRPKDDKKWWDELKKYLIDLETIGVDSVIVAHPFIMEIVKKYTKLELIASIICDVTSVRSALYYESMGADVIVPSSSINYDLELLKDIKNNLKKARIKLLVNEPCLGNCPWRKFHHNAICHAKEKGYDKDYAEKCIGIYKKNPYYMLTNNVIRPEDLKKYEGICDYFKLIGRTTDSDSLYKMIKAYSTECYKGNLNDIVDKGFSQTINLPNEKLEDFFDHKSKCLKNCLNCNYCKELYEKINKGV